MPSKLLKYLKPTSLAIYALVTIALGVTTFLSPVVYGSFWFSALWGVFALCLVAMMAVTKMWRQAPRFLLHVSLLAMLGGGLLTALTRKSGHVRIMPGEEATAFFSPDGKSIPLPCGVTLENFEVVYYPGGVVPRDYVSHLLIDGERRAVSMNNTLDIDGYRFLQASYDDYGATVLMVEHDPFGMTLSYAGYIMFAVGGIWLLLAPRGRFRTLLREMAMAAALAATAGAADAATIQGVPRATADSMMSRQVLYEGRVVCFNTLARDVVTKLYGKPYYRGLSPEQTLLSLRLFPEKWKDEPLLKVKDRELRRILGINGSHASLSQLFDSAGNYRVDRLYGIVGEKRLRAVEELDEKVGIVLSLYSGDLIVNPPEDSPGLSETRVGMELMYNRIPFTSIIFISLFCGFLSGMASLLFYARGMLAARVFLALAFAASLCCFLWQWYLADRLPLSNTFETLQFVVLMIELLLMLVAWQGRLLLPVGLLMAGSMALVAHLVEMNPVVTPLMPVLHSGWLSLHVSLVMMSYAILGFTFVNSVTAFINKSAALRLATLSSALLYPGVLLLGLGIFSGAVWANVSWGQYWSWDPKETWALITLLVYALPLHRGVVFLNNPRSLHLYLLLAILSLAMTYFGVNYLNSMHAYN